MSPHRLGALFLALTALAAACNEETRPHGTGTPPIGAGGAGGAGGDGAAPPARCGDGVIDPGEDCDGEALGELSCASFNHASGALACASDCSFDLSGCADPESCVDGLDNDKDGALDCDDTDCAAACADPCAAVVTLADPATITATTAGHPHELASACASPAGGGPELVFRVKAAQGGVLEATLGSDANLGLAARGACAGPELTCSDASAGPAAVERIELPVAAGDEIFLVVAGFSAADAGAFLLDVRSRAIACGDGHADGPEACDDGNTIDGDGCGASCQLESTESEPNETTAAANPLAAPWYAAISPAGDVDVLQLVVGDTPSTLSATIDDFDGASCASGAIDTLIELLDDGGGVIAAAEGGNGACSALTAPGLAAGTYYLRVAASPFATSQTFAYRLAASVIHDVCGDGQKGGSEACDDGNTANGDGCSAACQFELTEKEPNDDVAGANGYLAPWHAAISPIGDADVVAIAVPGPASTLIAQVVDHGTGDCAAKIVSRLEILDAASNVLAQSDGTPGYYCGFAVVNDLPAGTYYARVKASPLAIGVAQTFAYGLALDLQ